YVFSTVVCFQCCGCPRDLHSFPTRRSSDLLLMPHAHQRDRMAIVEQSCDTIAQAPTLVRLFPEARFVHVVRDGRDASASRVGQTDRKSTRLNSSHVKISYAVFCLKKKTKER